MFRYTGMWSSVPVGNKTIVLGTREKRENMVDSVVVSFGRMSRKLAEFDNRNTELGTTGDHGLNELANCTTVAKMTIFKSKMASISGRRDNGVQGADMIIVVHFIWFTQPSQY
jgi:hypothetical protein